MKCSHGKEWGQIPRCLDCDLVDVNRSPLAPFPERDRRHRVVETARAILPHLAAAIENDGSFAFYQPKPAVERAFAFAEAFEAAADVYLARKDHAK